MASNLASELSGTQVVELIACLGRAGLKPEKAKELMGDHEKMAEFVKNGLKKDPYLAIPAAGAYARYAARAEGRVFSVSIEYIQPAYDMLKNAFDWVYEGYSSAQFKPIEICKEVSIESRKVQFELVHVNRDTSTEMVLAELDRHELRPALYEELLGFAIQHPDEQRKHPIVALGSVCRGEGDHLYSPYLNLGDNGRLLDFYCISGPWRRECLFLGVPK